MTDVDKVIQHFQDAIEASGNNNKWRFVRLDIIEDTISLLKEQDAKHVIQDRQCEVEPNVWERKGFCPKCHQEVLWTHNRLFCGFCGQAVKWE